MRDVRGLEAVDIDCRISNDRDDRLLESCSVGSAMTKRWTERMAVVVRCIRSRTRLEEGFTSASGELCAVDDSFDLALSISAEELTLLLFRCLTIFHLPSRLYQLQHAS